jgi:hypothetical protein
MSIPISGPYAVGRIIVVANKHANQWKFETLEVELDGQDERIPLRAGGREVSRRERQSNLRPKSAS